MTSQKDTLTVHVGPNRSRWRRRAAGVVLALAVLAQGSVLFVTFVSGLVWDGWTYQAAVLQALLLLGALVVILAHRRTWLALAVPVLSAALSVGLFAHFDAVEAASACTQDMADAVAPLTPPHDTKVTFTGEAANGCIARLTLPASDTARVLAHYRREFNRHGWQVTAEEPDFLVATKDRIVVTVEAPEGEGGLVVMEVSGTV